MKHPNQLVRDMIGHNYAKKATCPQCGGLGCKFCSNKGEVWLGGYKKPYQCNKCDEDFTTVQEAKHHVDTAHK